MLAQFKKLIEVKSLTTLSLTATFIVMSLNGVIDKNIFMMIFLPVMTYFFTRKKDGA